MTKIEKQKVREILHRAAELIVTGKDDFCCTAIEQAGGRFLDETENALKAIQIFKPKGRPVDLAWWPLPGCGYSCVPSEARVFALLLAAEML